MTKQSNPQSNPSSDPPSPITSRFSGRTGYVMVPLGQSSGHTAARRRRFVAMMIMARKSKAEYERKKKQSDPPSPITSRFSGRTGYVMTPLGQPSGHAAARSRRFVAMMIMARKSKAEYERKNQAGTGSLPIQARVVEHEPL
jgi:hypothetical protein